MWNISLHCVNIWCCDCVIKNPTGQDKVRLENAIKDTGKKGGSLGVMI